MSTGSAALAKVSDQALHRCAKAAAAAGAREVIHGQAMTLFITLGQMAGEELERRQASRKSTSVRQEPREGSSAVLDPSPAGPLVASRR